MAGEFFYKIYFWKIFWEVSMGIAFSPGQWDKIRDAHTKWWNRELERPLAGVVLTGKDPGRPKPSAPLLSQATCTDLSVSAKDLIDRIDYELSQEEYLGDAFPFVNFDCFGPGVAAALLGATLSNATGSVWFHPKQVVPIEELHFEYDPNNIWLNRIKEIYEEGNKRWQGQVLMGMPDLGGTLDVLSTFRPGEALMYDLYDEPEEVKRVIWEIHELWFRYYREFEDVLQPVNPGYSDWARIYSDTPSYVVQCDASYMISPAMFDEFVLPELSESCKKLDRTIYHLDGIGELNHLDSILTIKELAAVQWVPGAGQPGRDQWPQVQKKIIDGGKNIQIDGFSVLDNVSRQVGTGGKYIHMIPEYVDISRKAEMIERLKSYGID